MKAEDAIFGILQDARGRKEPMNDSEKGVLREHVAKLVEANFKERELRIDKARKSLDDATARLADDRKGKDGLVEDRLNQYLREGARPLKVDRQDGRDRPGRTDSMHMDAKRE